MPNPELIIAVSALLTGIFAFIGQYRSGQLSAKKDEVTLLRDEVTRLQSRVEALEQKNSKLNGEIDQLRQENGMLREEIVMLRALLRRNNIDIPASKIFPASAV